ncbi:MAG: hypothetical protein AAF806_02575 [Bacteroidota bacterium]
MKIYFAIFLLTFIQLTSYSQVEGDLALATTIGYSSNGIPSLGAGLAIGYFDYYYYHSLGAGVTMESLIPLAEDKIWGVKFGTQAFIAVYPFGLDASIDIIYYKSKEISESHFSPSIGWSAGIINFKYAYSMPFQDNQLIDISKHQFTARIFIIGPRKPWKDIFFNKKQNKTD